MLSGNRIIAAVLFTALLTASCSDGRSSHITVLPNDSGTSDLGIGVPSVLLRSRRVNLNQLTVEVTVGGSPVAMARVGDQWRGRFSLPAGTDNYSLQVIWYQSLNGRNLPLASAQPVEINAQSDRDIHLSSYNWRQFDMDEDGTSNLDELNAGTDPFVAGAGATETTGQLTPGVDQSDCRDARDSLPTANFPADGIKLFARRFVFTASPAAGSERIFIFFYGDRSGRLTVEHLTGDPTPSMAALYDSDTSGTTRFLHVYRAPTADSRATVSFNVSPGIYCYMLGSSDDPALAEPFNGDVSISVNFSEN